MIINFLGDSITNGAGASNHDNCYVSLLRKEFPHYTINNYGIGGTRIARQDDFYTPSWAGLLDVDAMMFNLDFNARAQAMASNADYVFVFGGTNDFGHSSRPIGNENDTTCYTFYGALNTLLSDLIKRFGKDNVKFILPIHRYDDESIHGELFKGKEEVSEPLSTYRDIIKKQCIVYGVEYFDFYNDLPKPETRNYGEYFFDGIHPNDKGHRVLADLLKEIIKNLK